MRTGNSVLYLARMEHWVFGLESEVKESTKIVLDKYFVFWGKYLVHEKYMLKFAKTNDWVVYFNSNCNKFGKVSRSCAFCNVT